MCGWAPDRAAAPVRTILLRRRRDGGGHAAVPASHRSGPLVCVLLLVSLSGACSADEPDAPSAAAVTREEWATQTAQMLRNGIAPQGPSTTIVLPAVAAGDAYTASLALVGAGDSVGAVVDSVGKALVVSRVRAATGAEKLQASIAGPVATAAVLLRADQHTQLLGDKERQALAGVVDEVLGRKPADVYEAAAAVGIATSLGHRTDEARALLVAQLREAPVGCSGSESLYALGAAAEHLGEVAGLGCAPEQISALWTAEATKAEGALAGHDATPGLGEAEAVLALARLTRFVPGPGPREVVSRLINSLDAAFAQGRVTDSTPVAADLALAASAISVKRAVPLQVERYLREVVRGEGDAILLALDATSVPLVHRAARAVGSSVRVPMPAGTSDQNLEHVLGSELDPSRPLRPEEETRLVAALSTELAKQAPGSAVLRALAQLGTSSCQVPKALEAARAAATVAANRSTVGDLTTRALALRVLATCHEGGASSPVRGLLLAHAKQVLESTTAESDRPSLVEAWQAAAVACALDPELLRDRNLWELYREEAAPTGGAKDDNGAFVDLGATFLLASLTNPDRASCTATGVIG